jgi:hypothetical protein
MDAPFPKRHRSAKVEALSNHFIEKLKVPGAIVSNRELKGRVKGPGSDFRWKSVQSGSSTSKQRRFRPGPQENACCYTGSGKVFREFRIVFLHFLASGGHMQSRNRSNESFLLKVLGFCLAFSVAQLSVAAPTWHTSTVKAIYPFADGNFVLIFDTDSVSCTGIGTSKYYYVTIGENAVTADGAKRIYAAASLAMALNKSVQVNFESATTSCFVNRLILYK